MSGEADKAVDTLNGFLRGEISAVETYRQAIEKLGRSSTSVQLEDCRQSHERRVATLRDQVAQRIPRVDAFLEVLEKESAESSETFVLGYVSQFMDQQPAVSPMSRLNQDAVTQCHPNCV